MGLLEQLKANSSTFHIRKKEEIDMLFDELEESRRTVDNKLDFLIRMSIQQVKLQLYYSIKVDEYRRKPLSVKIDISKKDDGTIAVVAQPKTKQKERKRVRKPTSIELQHEMEKGQSKEQLIAANKARIAKFHPSPDLTAINPKYAQELRKLEEEKKMRERMKGKWVSIVSIPIKG